jgi:hypothetical protein
MASVTSPFDIGVAGVEYAVGFCWIAQLAVFRLEEQIGSSKPAVSVVVEVAHLADPENCILLPTFVLKQDISLVPVVSCNLFFVNIVLV